MDKIVTINHTKENTIEFDLTMDGIEVDGIVVKMMVESKGMELGFKASRKEKDTWAVKLPKLPMLERTAYKFYIEVHADGYYFEPFKGTLNVVGSAEVYSSDPKNVTLDSTADKKKEEKKPSSKEEKTSEKKVSENMRHRSREKGIDQIARELIEQQENNLKSPKLQPSSQHTKPIVAETKTVADEKHDRVEQILREFKDGKGAKANTTPVEQIARELMETQEFSPEKIDKKIKEVSEAIKNNKGSEKDEKVIAILEEVGIVPTYKKKRRFSITS